MGISLGELKIIAMYQGESKITKAFLGEIPVWGYNDIEPYSPVAYQDLTTWRSDLDAHGSYVMNMNSTLSSYATTSTSNSTFKLSCTKTGKVGYDETRATITKSDGGTIFKKDKFYKVSFKIRGKSQYSGGTFYQDAFAFNTHAFIEEDKFVCWDGIQLTDEYVEVDCVVWCGYEDITKMEIELRTSNQAGDSYGSYVLSGDYVEVKDFKTKEYDTYPAMPINDYYNTFSHDGATKFENLRLYNTTTYSYYKTINDETNNTMRLEMTLVPSYTTDIKDTIHTSETFYPNFELEPYRAYRISGYVKGTSGIGEMILGYDTYLFDEFNIFINDNEYTYFSVDIPRRYTTYYNNGFKKNLALGINTNRTLEVGDFIEIKDLVIERLD